MTGYEGAMAAVSFDEAVALLRWLLIEPDRARTVRRCDDETSGLIPVLAVRDDQGIEVLFGLNAGVVFQVSGIRIGDRFSDASDWDDNPWDGLRDAEAAMLELGLRR